MRESPAHYKGKIALFKLLLEDGYNVSDPDNEQTLPVAETGRGPREYTLDLLAEKDRQHYAFEVDGKKGHNTKRDLQKMDLRDRTIWEQFKIKTVRIRTWDLVGPKKQTPELIKSDIAYQISRYDAAPMDRPRVV